MSRLIDELNSVAKAASQPIGFKTARPAPSEPRILLIASMAKIEDTAHLAERVDGANAVLLRLTKSDLTASKLQNIVASVPYVSWGGWLDDIDAKRAEALVKAGCDFMVFTASNPVVATPQDDKVGRILQVEVSLGDGLLRAINDLAVDAVLSGNIYEAGESMAWHHLMLFQHLANLLTKPLLVPVPANVTASELKDLWEVGVDGVVVEASTGRPVGKLRELRQAIDKLPPRSSRKRGKAEALLPYSGGIKDTETEEEEYE
jgi:hypothetical protein